MIERNYYGYLRKSLARVIFCHFCKKYGNKIEDGQRNIIFNFSECKINFNGEVLRFFMLWQNDRTTYLTVFDKHDKKILVLMSSLRYEEQDGKKQSFETQYLNSGYDTYPSEDFVKEVYALLEKNQELKEVWPKKQLGLLRVA